MIVGTMWDQWLVRWCGVMIGWYDVWCNDWHVCSNDGWYVEDVMDWHDDVNDGLARVSEWLARWCLFVVWSWWFDEVGSMIGWHVVSGWLVDCYIIVMDGIVTTWWWWCYCQAQPRQVDDHNDRQEVSSAKRSYFLGECDRREDEHRLDLWIVQH